MFELTQEQKDLQKLANDFAKNVIRPGAMHHDETGEWPDAIMKKRIGRTEPLFKGRPRG